MVRTTDTFECPVYPAKQVTDYDVTVYTIGIGAGANGDLPTAMVEGIDPHGGDPQTIFTNAKGGKYLNAAKPTDLKLIFNAILLNIYVPHHQLAGATARPSKGRKMRNGCYITSS
ncbi:MAG: hypothetical protein U0401_02855 [Anaerolineae bacterium]